MKFDVLVKIVGHDWAQLLKGFMCPVKDGESCPFDEIAARLKNAYDSKKVVPDMRNVWNAFKETPLDQVRVVLMAKEPYFVETIPNLGLGIACGLDNYEALPKSLKAIYKAIEQDVYGGLDLQQKNRSGIPGRPDEDGSIKLPWHKQGVLMLNAALTVEVGAPGSHLELWQPFMNYLIAELQKVKRNLIFVAWGTPAKQIMDYRKINDDGEVLGVSMFNSFLLQGELASDCLREGKEYVTNNFSRINLLIRNNRLGEPIIW